MTVPCGPATVTFERDRWATLSRSVVANPGEDLTFDEKLARPPARLRIVSTPPGAAVSVNGRGAGKTPLLLPVMRFEAARIDVRLAGHKPWRQTVYVKESQQDVGATLTPASGRQR